MEYQGFTLDTLWISITHKRLTPQRQGKSDKHTLSVFFTINKNSLRVNNISHIKVSHQYRKGFEKPAQALLIKEIGEGKFAAFQHLVDFFAEKKEMKQCETELAPRVKNIGPESAPGCSPQFNPFIITSSTPANPMQAKPNGLSKIKEIEPTPK